MNPPILGSAELRHPKGLLLDEVVEDCQLHIRQTPVLGCGSARQGRASLIRVSSPQIHRLLRVSILGIIMMVLDRYLVFGYLEASF